MLKNILVIDYSEHNLTKLDSILHRRYNLKKAINGEQGLEILREEEILVALLNLETTDINSTELIETIVARHNNTQIISYTSTKDMEACISSLKAGAFFYFNFPIEPEVLKNKILIAEDRAGSIEQLRKVYEKRSVKAHNATTAMDIIQKLMLKRNLDGEALTTKEFFYLLPATEQANQNSWFNEFTSHIKNFRQEKGEEENQITVLVVDDDENMQDSLNDILEEHYNVLAASNGPEAIKLAKETKLIDIVLLDIHMPGPKGHFVLPELKAVHPDSEIIIITAYKDTEIASIAFDRGAYTYLCKPFFRSTLLATISDALQAKYIKKALAEIGETPTDFPLTFTNKTKLITEYYNTQKIKNRAITFGEVFAFYPNLTDCGIPDEEVLPMDLEPQHILSWISDKIESLS
jgi:DNA-binding NtrC family response regulator